MSQKTINGLYGSAVDCVCAGIGWVEMGNREKAIDNLKKAISYLLEAQAQITIHFKEADNA